MSASPVSPLSLGPPPSASGLATDTRSLDSLKSRAATDPKGAVREAARQFESLFMNELVKSMRSTTLSTGALDNAGSAMGTDMLDTQMATQLSGRPGGLSDAIMKQLERQMGLSPGPIPATGTANNTPVPLDAGGQPTRLPQAGAAGFLTQHTDAAKAAESQSGIPATFMLSQAALETGWGRKEILNADGSSSHNLFGIKADASWKGPVAEVTTTEVVSGRAVKGVAKFRAYASYAESFADYGRLMTASPRYQNVVAQAQGGTATGFAQGLQRAGYATDPAYADKLSRVINTTLRLQRATG
jgi:flagellar protein FlgJ